MRTAGALALVLFLAAPVFAAGMLAQGDVFPSWTATNEAGKPVSSADYEGRAYLLWFYPKASSPG